MRILDCLSYGRLWRLFPAALVTGRLSTDSECKGHEGTDSRGTIRQRVSGLQKKISRSRLWRRPTGPSRSITDLMDSVKTSPEYLVGIVSASHEAVVIALAESPLEVSYISYPKTLSKESELVVAGAVPPKGALNRTGVATGSLGESAKFTASNEFVTKTQGESNEADIEAGGASSSWVYRPWLFSHYQLHVNLFEDPDAEEVFVYCHHERNWLRHPISHLRQSYLNPEWGREQIIELLADTELSLRPCCGMESQHERSPLSPESLAACRSRADHKQDSETHE